MAQGGLAETGKVKRRAWRHVFLSSELRWNLGGTGLPPTQIICVAPPSRMKSETGPSPPADHNGKVLTA